MLDYRNYFTFGGIDSRSVGVYISGTGVFDEPEKATKWIEVPGRNGDILGIEKRLRNVDLKYPAFVVGNFFSTITEMKNKFMSKQGYQILSDTYYPAEFRKAVYVGGTTFEPEPLLNASQFEIKFRCKPQRYLTSGNTASAVANNGTLSNPTLFDSEPLIYVKGYGTLTINGKDIEITDAFSEVYIDSEVMDCYSGSDNANGAVSFEDNDFPKLVPGTNTFVYDNTITQLKVTPRWWQL